MVPTKDRNHSSMLLKYRDENILIDCGEGTQRQLRKAKISAAKLTRILISHWHGDHILGLPGLVQTMGANEFKGVLQVYGPKGTKAYMKKMTDWFSVETRINMKVTDIAKQEFLETDQFTIEAFRLHHSAPCLAYKFIEKDCRKMDMIFLKKIGLTKHPILRKLQEGKDITWDGKKVKVKDATTIKKGQVLTIIMDTRFAEDIIDFAKGSDLIISESTFDDSLKEKAISHAHMTASQAATIAKKANAKRLILTHFSQRYKDVTHLKKEAKKIFKNTECAEDFMEVKL